jgi:hypothetical protein
LYRPEIVDEVEISTMDVLMVNDALVAPAGMNTLAGTLAAPLLLERVTCAPPAGAGALRNTVPVEDCWPPTTLVGFSVSEASVGAGGGTGFTVSDAVLLTPP